LSEISQGAEAEEEISQIMSEISQGGGEGEGAEERRSLSKIVRDLSRRRSRRINLSNNVRHSLTRTRSRRGSIKKIVRNPSRSRRSLRKTRRGEGRR
jgi:hypothetical protein